MLRVSADSGTLIEVPFTVDAGAVYSVLILDTPTGLAVVTQVDALATGVVPAGGVETGQGGMADSAPAATGPSVLPFSLGLTGIALCMLIGTTGLARRTRARAG